MSLALSIFRLCDHLTWTFPDCCKTVSIGHSSEKLKPDLLDLASLEVVHVDMDAICFEAL